MNRTVLTAAAAFAAASGAVTMAASAADMGYMPPPVYQPTWQGLYVGGHLGFGEAAVEGSGTVDFGSDFDDEGFFDDGDFDFEDGVLTVFHTTLSPDWLIGGAQAGYNWQAASLVLGIEGDVSFADWSHDTDLFDTDAGDLGGPYDEYAFATASAKVDMLASVRGRLGYAFDSVMVYGTGGVAWADARAGGRLYVEDAAGAILLDESRATSFDDIGFVAGGGLSWMVIPETFSVGLEGLYYFFDQNKTLYDSPFEYAEGEFAQVRVTARLDDAWVVRARGDFHF